MQKSKTNRPSRFRFDRPRAIGFAVAACALLFLAGEARAESLWRDDTSRSMFADKRARAMGDIITIIVQENNAASRQNNTRTAKKTGIDASISSFLYSPQASGLLTKRGKLPALKADARTEFEGGGAINNAERLTARIAVRVIDVLPNGNLVIEGRRETAFSGEKQDAILRGVVRQEDIQANNTVFSYHVADSTIQFVSRGTISDNQRKGWFTRVWEKVTPF
jgi:flagellar L-ring protein FlgH